jgi:hypothetical protein
VRRTLIALIIALACAPAPAFAQSGPNTTPTVRSSQIFTDAQRQLVERYKRGPAYAEALAAARQAARQQIDAPRPVSQPAAATGFDWASAAAGAAAALGLILLPTAGVLLVRRRGDHEQPIAAS